MAEKFLTLVRNTGFQVPATEAVLRLSWDITNLGGYIQADLYYPCFFILKLG